MTQPTSPLTEELNAALEWWRMAGVDHDFADDATDWLAEPRIQAAPQGEQSAPPSPSNQPAHVGGQENRKAAPSVEQRDLLGDSPPKTLDEFRAWWLEEPGLDAIGPRGRTPPRGTANPEIMILVIDPEQDDQDRLLSGRQGQLLSRMLAAMGINEDETYIASALPRHTPMADTNSLALGGMDAVTLHHVGLVSPQKLLTFGTGILPLLGQDVSKSETSLREINQVSSSVPILMSEGMDSLLTMPRLKARFWRRWIEWSVGK